MGEAKPSRRRDPRRVRVAGLIVCTLPGLALAAVETPPTPPAPLPLAWCLARAAQANPDLAGAAAGAEAARAAIVPAGALEDPRVAYEASNLPLGDFDFSSTPLSGHQLGLRQKLPFPGLLGQRERAARAGADHAGNRVADEARRLAARVEQAWAELGFAQRALEITERNIGLLRQLTRIAETKYQVGKGLQQDVLRAQVQLTRLLDERLHRLAEIERREAELAALLDLPPDVALSRTEELGDAREIPVLEELMAGLEQTSPRLAGLRAGIVAAEHRRRAAQLEGYPDADLGLGYRIRRSVPGDRVEGDDFLSLGVTLRLPVHRGRWRAEVAARDAELRRAQAAYRSALAGLREVVRQRFADLRRADAETDLLETGLVPQSHQALESSRAGYEVDKVDFLTLIDGQVNLLAAELSLVRARADRRSAFAALEAAVGVELR